MRMFNGVSHAYHIARPEKLTSVTDGVEGAMDIDNDDSELAESDKVLKTAMDSMAFDEEDELPEEFGPLHGHKSYSVKNIWNEGWEAIQEMNVKEVHENTSAQQKRKRSLAKYSVKKVSKLRQQLADVNIGSQMVNVNVAPWMTYIHSLCPNVLQSYVVNLSRCCLCGGDT